MLRVGQSANEPVAEKSSLLYSASSSEGGAVTDRATDRPTDRPGPEERPNGLTDACAAQVVLHR